MSCKALIPCTVMASAFCLSGFIRSLFLARLTPTEHNKENQERNQMKHWFMPRREPDMIKRVFIVR